VLLTAVKLKKFYCGTAKVNEKRGGGGGPPQPPKDRVWGKGPQLPEAGE